MFRCACHITQNAPEYSWINDNGKLKWVLGAWGCTPVWKHPSRGTPMSENVCLKTFGQINYILKAGKIAISAAMPSPLPSIHDWGNLIPELKHQNWTSLLRTFTLVSCHFAWFNRLYVAPIYLRSCRCRLIDRGRCPQSASYRAFSFINYIFVTSLLKRRSRNEAN